MTPWSLLVPRKALRWGRLTERVCVEHRSPIWNQVHGWCVAWSAEQFPVYPLCREDNPS